MTATMPTSHRAAPVSGRPAAVDGSHPDAVVVLSLAAPTPRGETMPVTMRACPVCQAEFAPVGRQRYCGNSCRQIAFRRRQPRATVVIPRSAPVRRVTGYQCPECDAIYLGVQRCEDCGVFCRRVGLAGNCPHCDEVVTVHDLLQLDDAAVIDSNDRSR